jgi:hypothetical protein
MSLRAFHLFFLALSVILAAFSGAWAFGQYQAVHQVSYVLAGVACFACGVGLAGYGAAFQRKTKNL